MVAALQGTHIDGGMVRVMNLVVAVVVVAVVCKPIKMTNRLPFLSLLTHFFLILLAVLFVRN